MHIADDFLKEIQRRIKETFKTDALWILSVFLLKSFCHIDNSYSVVYTVVYNGIIRNVDF